MTIHGFDFLNVRPSPPPPPEKNLDPRFTMQRKAIIINDINVLGPIYKLMHEHLRSYAAKRLLGKECISIPSPVDSFFILRRGQKMQI